MNEQFSLRWIHRFDQNTLNIHAFIVSAYNKKKSGAQSDK